MFCLLLGPAKERNFEMTINVKKIDSQSLGRLKTYSLFFGCYNGGTWKPAFLLA
jgi:hypothetical protein